MVSGSASTPAQRGDDRFCCGGVGPVLQPGTATERGKRLDCQTIRRGHRGRARKGPRARPAPVACRCAARPRLVRRRSSSRRGAGGGPQGRAAADALHRARRSGYGALAPGDRSGAAADLGAPQAPGSGDRGSQRPAARRGAGARPRRARRVALPCGARRASPRAGRRRRLLDRRGGRAEGGAARAAPRGGAAGRIRAPLAHRSASAGDDPAPLSAQPAAHASVCIQ